MRNGEIEFSWGCLNRKVVYMQDSKGYFSWSKREHGAAVRMSNFLVYGCLTSVMYGCLTSWCTVNLTSWCTDV